MGGGAVIAAAAGARRRRMAEVIEAFREAGANTPDRARPLDEVVTGRVSEVSRLAEAGVLVSVPDRASFYVDESAYAAWSASQRRTRSIRMLVALAVVLLAAGLVFLFGVQSVAR